MNYIKNNLEEIKLNIKNGSSLSPYNEKPLLVCVSKYRRIEEIEKVIEVGVKDFGENKVKEFLMKYEVLKDSVNWHFIGHLQRNKVKDIVGKVSLIHSVDSLRLLEKIDIESKKKDIVSDILLEVNVSMEESKYGFTLEEVEEAIKEASRFKNIKVKGFMCMAPFTNDEGVIKEVFMNLRKTYEKYTTYKGIYDNICIDILSMGMSNDYELALECGSNLVRIGTSIFKGDI